MAEDSGLHVRHMNPDKQKQGCHYPKKKELLKDFHSTEAEELEDWIPAEAFRVAHEFSNKCSAGVSKSLMN